MHLLNSKLLSRRRFLRAAGVSLALPLLDAMQPAGLRTPAAKAATAPPRRLVFIGQPLGLHTPNLFPVETGRDYTETPYLKALGCRNDLTVLSGLSHPEYKAGHSADVALLTGAPWDRIKNDRDQRNTISVDQEAVEVVGRQTRYPCLVMGSNNFSWNRRGVRLPGDNNASTVFARLFIDGKPDEVKRVVRDLQDGRSIMDLVRDDAQRLQNRVGPGDRDRLDQYFTAIREAEQRLAQDEAWAAKPKPKVAAKQPNFPSGEEYLLERVRQWYDLVHLALQTDSTRVITLWLHGHGPVTLPDGKRSQHYHDLSHHGQSDDKIALLSQIETEEMRLLGSLLGKLKGTAEEGASLLDRTMLFFGSNLSNANSHSNQNLPIILAGGGFKHGQHIAFDPKNNKPLCNLYVTMLQKFGIEASRFGSSTGTIGELS